MIGPALEENCKQAEGSGGPKRDAKTLVGDRECLAESRTERGAVEDRLAPSAINGLSASPVSPELSASVCAEACRMPRVYQTDAAS
jgi:hypothetical protein